VAWLPSSAASASVGLPIRNMHTPSECGCTRDLTAAKFLMLETLQELASLRAATGSNESVFEHPDLRVAEQVTVVPPLPAKASKEADGVKVEDGSAAPAE
jgi:hypothetical protein